MPTTKAQVSGHRFLRRRVEHGLVMQDVRMIHDPLGTRKRAMVFGGIAAALICVGSGLLAWMQPEAAPGDAPVVRSAEGQLFVKIDEVYHPVANVASARIIAGGPVQPVAIGDGHLERAQLGSPVGIVDAPGFLAQGAGAQPGRWSACFAAASDAAPGEFATVIDSARTKGQGETVVKVGAEPRGLSENQAAVARVGEEEWLITGKGRAALPAADSTEGRVVRRGLGITAQTPRWAMPAEVLGAYPENPVVAFPSTLPELVRAGEVTWARTAEGVWRVSALQAQMLADMGAKSAQASAAEVAKLPDAHPWTRLPERAPELVTPEDGWLCASPGGEAAGPVAGVLAPVGGTVALSGAGVADRFAGLDAGGVGVDTGHGYHVVSATGQRHGVDDAAVLSALGVGAPAPAPWEVVRLLPEGTALTRGEALSVTY